MEQTTAQRWIDEVVEALDPAEIDVPGEVAGDFARQLLARASADFLERREPSRTAETVISLLAFVQETPSGEIGVRVRTGERGRRLIVETVMPDCSFIVNTLRECVHEEGFSIVHLLHPVLVLDRDEEGRLTGIGGRDAEGERTSVVHLVLEDEPDAAAAERLEDEVGRRLELVRRATGDFQPMLRKCGEIIGDLEREKERIPWRAAELEEIRDFLEWLRDDSFVFLGYRSYDLRTDEEDRRFIEVEEGSGLGILRDEDRSRYAEPRPLDELPSNLRARVLGGPLLIISKTNAQSPVHRRARMDYLGIKKLGPDGEVEGERRFLGLFTAKAYAQDASTIPILRRKLREILEAEQVPRGSHDYNQILQIFNSMPKEELFLASVPELLRVISAVMETEDADEVRVIPRSDPLARGINVVVMLPRDRFSEEVRRKIQRELLEVYEAELLNYHLTMNGGDQARLHFYLASDREEVDEVDVAALEEEVRSSVRSWEERLSDALHRSHGPERADRLDRRRDEFSTEYKATIDVDTAVDDLSRLERLEQTGLQQLALEPVDPDRPEATLLKVFAPRGMYVLSDLMPTLENLGLRVIEADKYDMGGQGAGATPTIHTFEVETPAEWGLDRREAEPRLAELLRAVHRREATDDRLNSLILSAGLTWRQVALLRAYAGYAFRIGAVASRAGVRTPLASHPRVSRLLFEIFEARHDPGVEDGRDARVARLVRRYHERLDAVRSIEHDRTFRRLLDLVRATTRTNFHQARVRERDGGVVALKFDCREVEMMPRPRPRYEIYVSGARTEGAHLRMGAVARGGIRWSDRSEDFRVEVLGLAKTQQVKNSVIVPDGAKGAFVVREPPADDGELRRAGVASYKEFIRGLLDLTDNIEAGEVVHPPETVVRDGEDPYLVVAADKGTAELSDTANELAAEYGFWLGDAFASGGSRGYDHKELGITARGAWECVRRHFGEMGKDVAEETFTVAGIGDMSGDVFGNGMLLSRNIRLVAAFDHRHVFLDPDPDPEASYRERERLFEMDRSTWRDYDGDAISEGGGVWDRDAKEIELPPEARDLLGVQTEVMNGEAVVRAILGADVDLLWNGGIGTYVKASDESHGEVGDPQNDGVRVDASDLRASVVGEGGNLGFTQRGRVEYALGGGRINTDALDNSAGVDMSDHEVNLKILLDAEVREGALDREGRDRLLDEVTEEVAGRVLSNNHDQSLAVSLDQRRVREIPAEFRDALVRLERDGLLDRNLEDLPTTEELVERQEEGLELTRPELAILLSYSKLHLKERIRASELTGDPALVSLLREYFPEPVVEAVEEGRLEEHPLRERIVATELTNRFVDRMGATCHLELMRETGRSAARVVRAWYCAARLAGAEGTYRRLRTAEGEVPAGVQLQWHLRVSRSLERAARWLLTHGDADRSLREAVARYETPVTRLRQDLPNLLTGERREELDRLRSLHETDGLGGGLAADLASLEYLDGLLPVAELARRHDVGADVVGEVYFGLTELVDFSWLQSALDRASGEDLWQQRAGRTLSLELETARARMAARIVRDVHAPQDVERAFDEYRRDHRKELDRVGQVLDEVKAAEHPSLSSLMVAVHAVRGHAAGGEAGPV